MTRMQRLCVAAVVAAGMGGALATPALAQSAAGPGISEHREGTATRLEGTRLQAQP